MVTGDWVWLMAGIQHVITSFISILGMLGNLVIVKTRDSVQFQAIMHWHTFLFMYSKTSVRL